MQVVGNSNTKKRLYPHIHFITLIIFDGKFFGKTRTHTCILYDTPSAESTVFSGTARLAPIFSRVESGDLSNAGTSFASHLTNDNFADLNHTGAGILEPLYPPYF